MQQILDRRLCGDDDEELRCRGSSTFSGYHRCSIVLAGFTVLWIIETEAANDTAIHLVLNRVWTMAAYRDLTMLMR